jgi:hypothetical protein
MRRNPEYRRRHCDRKKDKRKETTQRRSEMMLIAGYGWSEDGCRDDEGKFGGYNTAKALHTAARNARFGPKRGSRESQQLIEVSNRVKLLSEKTSKEEKARILRDHPELGL